MVVVLTIFAAVTLICGVAVLCEVGITNLANWRRVKNGKGKSTKDIAADLGLIVAGVSLICTGGFALVTIWI